MRAAYTVLELQAEIWSQAERGRKWQKEAVEREMHVTTHSCGGARRTRSASLETAVKCMQRKIMAAGPLSAHHFKSITRQCAAFVLPIITPSSLDLSLYQTVPLPAHSTPINDTLSSWGISADTDAHTVIDTS